MGFSELFAVSVQALRRNKLRSGKKKLGAATVTGLTATASSMLNIDLESGRFFTDAEERHAAPLAVIGYDIKDQLFPTVDAIGHTVYVHGFPLRVIGLQTRLGNVLGQNKDNVVFVPLSFLQKVLTSNEGLSVLVRPAKGMDGPVETEDEVRTILRALRKTPFKSDDAFGVVGSEAIQA